MNFTMFNIGQLLELLDCIHHFDIKRRKIFSEIKASEIISMF